MSDKGSDILSIRSHIGIENDNHLTLHGIDLIDVCKTYGTPLFVFDEVSFVENFERFRRAFENVYPKIIVCYSVKTNNNLVICRTLSEKGAYAEVSSELDLYIALKAGFRGEKIIYDGPFKPIEALRKALEEKILLINVESFKEMEELNDVAQEMGSEQAIGLRVNPFRPPSFFKSLTLKNLFEEAGYCYPSSRFGFSLEEIPKAVDYLEKFKNLRLECLMMHPYAKALIVLMPLLKQVNEKFGLEVRYLNIGGGFNPGVSGSTSDLLLTQDFIRRKLHLKSTLDKRKSPTSIETVARSIANELRQNLGDLPEPALITEPGRFIVGPSGMLLLRVDHTKIAGGYKWVLVNGGTNLVPVIFERRTILVANRAKAPNKERVNVVGPLLYPKDFIAIKTDLPQVEEDDTLAVLDCGAYSLSSSTQFLYPRPTAVLVDSKREVKVIREQETFEDVLRKDKLL
jgi:diaminopimelate decarboxylase